MRRLDPWDVAAQFDPPSKGPTDLSVSWFVDSPFAMANADHIAWLVSQGFAEEVDHIAPVGTFRKYRLTPDAYRWAQPGVKRRLPKWEGDP